MQAKGIWSLITPNLDIIMNVLKVLMVLKAQSLHMYYTKKVH